MLSRKPSKAVPVFQVKKKFSKRNNFFRFLEFILITLVVLGTGVWLLINSNFSFGGFVSGVLDNFKPQVATQEKKTPETVEDKIKRLLDGVVEVSEVTKTSQNFLEVKTKDKKLFLFSLEKNLDDQVRTLQTLLAKARIENRSLKKVDFRFEKIVVEY